MKISVPIFQKWIKDACRKIKAEDITKFTEIQISKRLTKTAGLASFSREKSIIRLSEPLFKLGNEKKCKNIVVHECCHILVFKNFDKTYAPHGKHWKYFMRKAGEEPKIKHDIFPEPKKVKAYCRCKVFYADPVVLKALKNKNPKCIRCGGKISV